MIPLKKWFRGRGSGLEAAGKARIFGMLEGDEVIISSMKNYLHLDEVPIR